MLDAPNVTCLRCSGQSQLSACCDSCIDLTYEELRDDISRLTADLAAANAKGERLARIYDQERAARLTLELQVLAIAKEAA